MLATPQSTFSAISQHVQDSFDAPKSMRITAVSGLHSQTRHPLRLPLILQYNIFNSARLERRGQRNDTETSRFCLFNDSHRALEIVAGPIWSHLYETGFRVQSHSIVCAALRG
ncbi:hypothetical protein TNCV_2312991 [Trichonephila clavipes]|nr:hypothetical protein TNCV_2312991 [Trichonephila clavipes]